MDTKPVLASGTFQVRWGWVVTDVSTFTRGTSMGGTYWDGSCSLRPCSPSSTRRCMSSCSSGWEFPHSERQASSYRFLCEKTASWTHWKTSWKIKMKLENWVPSESSLPPHAFILIKLELAVVWSTESMLPLINAKRNKYKKASHSSKRLTLCKELSISDSKVFLSVSLTKTSSPKITLFRYFGDVRMHPTV